MKVILSAPRQPEASTVVLIVAGNTRPAFFASLDQAVNGHLSRLLETEFQDIRDYKSVIIPQPGIEGIERLILVGFPEEKLTTDYACEVIGAKILTSLQSAKATTVDVYFPESEGLQSMLQKHACIINGMQLKSWVFHKYYTEKREDIVRPIEQITMLLDQVGAVSDIFDTQQAVTEGVFLTRHVVSEPPNTLYPETFAAEAKGLESLGVEVEILNEAAMQKLGMNALLGVGQGSERESYLVVMRWNGGTKGEAPVAFVGKGVTFDTGGISIKPSQDMDEMKYDMAGAGAVLGVMRALAGRKASVNAVGVLGLVENMPSGKAQRPGDIVRSLSGQTIEILNTDAEGRLVLADALWYTQDQFKPAMMINLATLTGAMVIGLGNEYAGLFSNDDALAQNLSQAGEETGDRVWRFPLDPAYDKGINSVVADMKNLGPGRGAGSIMAAQFLQRFVNNTPWAHLDIAGVAWDKAGRPLSAAGATAFGVRLLNRFVMNTFEKAHG